MLSNGFARPLHLKRRPSRQLAIYLLSVHALVCLALLQPLAVSPLLYAVCWLLWLLSGFYHLRRYWPRSYDETHYWVWQTGGYWICDAAPTPRVMQLADAVVTSMFIRVSLQDADTNRLHLYYFRDQLAPDTWRRLWVRLVDGQANARCSSGAGR